MGVVDLQKNVCTRRTDSTCALQNLSNDHQPPTCLQTYPASIDPPGSRCSQPRAWQLQFRKLLDGCGGPPKERVHPENRQHVRIAEPQQRPPAPDMSANVPSKHRPSRFKVL